MEGTCSTVFKGSRRKLRLRAKLPASLVQQLYGMTGVVVKAGAVTFPADARMYEWLTSYVDDLKVTRGTAHWYQRIQDEEKARLELKSPADVSLGEVGSDLWPFQRVAVNFMLHSTRTLLCDQPGLGKTATAIMAARLTRPNRRVMVLCPNTLKYWWESEIRVWHPGANVVVLGSGKSNREKDWKEYSSFASGYLIVNWEALRTMPQLEAQVWQWTLADEAHRVKNRETQMYRALSRVHTGKLVLITATPFANKPAELWTLLHLVAPHKYTSYWRFFEMYTDYNPYDPYRAVTGVRNPELLARELAPVMMRRTKEECLPQLPAKTYTTIRLKLGPQQARAYKLMAEEMYLELEGGDWIEAVNALSLLTRLRQLVSTTYTLDTTDYSAKLDAVVELIEDAPEEPFVVFAQFRKTVEALARRLKAASIEFIFVLGGIGSEEVAKRVAEFQEGKARVFVATAQTGGVGLTLTAASTLIFVDKHYSPAVQEQAEDRIHRAGQKAAVQIISLVCDGTVDELVEKILKRKITMIDTVLRQELLTNLAQYLEK